MDYEQKYKEALEKARKRVATEPQDHTDAILKDIFPELAESEDERIRKGIVETIKQCPDTFLNPKNRDEMLTWLEKQKEQKPEWSEWDEKVYESIQTILLAEARFVEERKWFDSIKARIRSVCWSEEDEKKISFLERLIRYNVPEGQYGWADGHKSGFITKSEAISKLKSLRPSWKPSEEQMEALRRAVNKLAKTDVADSVRLSIMYDNLKKLM